jgi:hypothetical protein
MCGHVNEYTFVDAVESFGVTLRRESCLSYGDELTLNLSLAGCPVTRNSSASFSSGSSGDEADHPTAVMTRR